MIEIIKSDLLQNLSGIQHGFFTKKGGVSTGIYSSLNCSYESKDNIENVRENRQRAMNYFNQPRSSLVVLHDVHGSQTVVVEEPWNEQTVVTADGMVTKKPGIVLGVLGADCPGILFADVNSKIIGIAHAGWKGAKNGIIESVISCMISMGSCVNNIYASISPCIGVNSYEVDAKFHQLFCESYPENKCFFVKGKKKDHFLFNLRNYIKNKLIKQGVKHISSIDIDTYQDEERFYSYRRTTHLKESDFGCHLSCSSRSQNRS